jgi:UDP-glucuronate 4-epimerase
MNILITGCAGFIGFHVTKKLLKSNNNIYGIDNYNSYYDKNLKKKRIYEISSIKNENFKFFKFNLKNKKKIFNFFNKKKIDIVIHLSAQAGVRYSLSHPYSYIDNNIYVFMNILECCRIYKIKHLVLASTSSVYGLSKKTPFIESQGANHPIQLYAATKRSNELMAHSYSHLFNIPTTVLRFFTVYGPWGRPDMALFKFVKKIYQKKPILLFNKGDHIRDFTYIDDLVNVVNKIYKKIPKSNLNFSYKKLDPSESPAPFKIFNISSGKPIKLMKFIKIIENAVKLKAKKSYLGLQPGDIKATKGSIKKIKQYINFTPRTNIKNGVKKFISWYNNFYKV